MASLLTFAALLAAAQVNYNHGDPTPEEQLFLELINRARRDPEAEGARLGIDIKEGLGSAAAYVRPRPPLAFNAALFTAARAHRTDMYTNNYFSHVFPPPPDPNPVSFPDTRMESAGYTMDSQPLADPWAWGENIAAMTSGGPLGLHDLLVKDVGVSGRGHRRNILDIWPAVSPPANNPFPLREIGIGYQDFGADKSNIAQEVVVQDFGRRAPNGPFLVGVVTTAANTDLFYAPAEADNTGVRIRIGGHAWQAIASASGGYALPIAGAPTHPDGYVRVFADSGVFTTTLIERRYFPTGNNIKLDFCAGDLVDTDLDGLPDYWENFYLITDASSDTDNDGATALEEYYFGSSPLNELSTPEDPLGEAGAPADEGDEPEGCGALGVEFLLLLAIRGFLRRR